MKLNFNKDGAATTTVNPTVEENPRALATTTSRQVAIAMPQADDFAGEWLRTDQRLPRLNLVQKVSDTQLVRDFGISAIVLAKEVKLGDEETPVVATALAAVKDYIQKVPFDSGEQPAVFKSEEEVINSGGSLNYKDLETGQFFQPRAHIEFAVPAPEGLDENALALFPYEFKSPDGKSVPYALALYTVASSAYTSLAKELATMRSANKVLRQGLRYGSLKISAEVRKRNTKAWYVPVARFNGANSPELIAFFESIEPALKAKP
jgi:hypothetical protein